MGQFFFQFFDSIGKFVCVIKVSEGIGPHFWYFLLFP